MTRQPTEPMTIQDLSVRRLEQDPDGPRVGRPDKDLLWLAASIKAYNVMIPLHVNKLADGRYVIIDGNRRHSCAVLLGLDTVPCIIYSRLKRGDAELLRWRLHELVDPLTDAEEQAHLERIRALVRGRAG